MEQPKIFSIPQDTAYYKEIYIDVVDPSQVENQLYLPINVNGDLYLFLKLIGINLNDEEEPIAVQDYFMIDEVAIDCKNGLFRLFPKLPNNYLSWDPNNHTIKSVKDTVNDYRLA